QILHLASSHRDVRRPVDRAPRGRILLLPHGERVNERRSHSPGVAVRSRPSGAHMPHTATRRYLTAICATLAAVLLQAPAASSADEIRVLSSVGLKAVLDELAPQFEKSTRHKVTVVFGLAGALKTQIEKGEPFDVAVLTPP